MTTTGATRAPASVPARAISGFPEFTPDVRAAELRWIDAVRAVFESYGFASVETRLVEEIDVLARQGEDVDKEIYQIHRLAGAAGGGGRDPRLGVHYDLTVPFARYVTQHAGKLQFPFKRYQIQKSYRGERPQEGRFREFTQCDIDVVDRDSVSLFFDAELAKIIIETLTVLDIGPVDLRINNRKILEGFFTGIEASNPAEAIRILDKLDKIGEAVVLEQLRERAGLSAVAAQSCLALARVRAGDLGFVDGVRDIGVRNALLDEGLDELAGVMSALTATAAGDCRTIADLSVARGLDYYTGTVYEAKFRDFPAYPSIVGGGRYDDLTSSFSRARLPGVGISIGLTRIFTKALKEGLVQPGRPSPTDVLVVWRPDEEGPSHVAVADRLRARGLRVEAHHERAGLDKQLKYAHRRGIPFVVFPGRDQEPQVKDMRSGRQEPIDLDTWRIPVDALEERS